jgi:ATP-dependent Clp protease ATP-binding subunit ClpA
LKRLIQKRIENGLATALLEGSIKVGDTVSVTLSGEGVDIRPKG